MKGCLKLNSRAPSPNVDQTRSLKSVAFNADGSEQVFVADEWDRTPMEPSRNLTYQDILELKEIQRSLPRAVQPADLISGRPASHYLSNVPIGLLPLLPEADTSLPPSPTVASSFNVSPSSWRTIQTPAPTIPAPTPTWHPSHLAHLPPGRPPIDRQKPRFAFLPLLETPPQTPSSPPLPCSPPPSERSTSPDPTPSDSDVSHDPPTPSLTNASLDSSPLSRASSCSPEPPFFQLPPSRHARGGEEKISYFPAYSDEQPPDRWINNTNQQPAAMFTTTTTSARVDFNSSCKPVPIPTVSKPITKKKKNIIVVNDMVIELDGDDDDDDDCGDDQEEEGSTPPAKSPSIPLPTSPPSPTLRSSSSTTPSSHAPICFKRLIPPPTTTHTSGPPSSSSSSSSSSRGPGYPRYSNSMCGGGRKEATSPPNSARGRSSPVLVPSA